MARPLRLEYPGAIYHVTSRGNARQPIFDDYQDRSTFLSVLSDVITRFNWLCYAYCLMDNHYHLLIETPDGNLSRGMRQLNGVYTQRYNRRHSRAGHVFQGRFKAIVVERDSYLLELCRYIVLNPVRANMTKDPAEYRWSSYRATLGQDAVPSFLQTDGLLAQFDSNREVAKQRYQSFVMAGIGGASPWDKVQGQIILGDEAFVEQITAVLQGAMIKEVPKKQRYVNRPSLESVLENVREDNNKLKRNEAIRKCYVEYGYTMREIANFLGLHYTTVSKVVDQST